MIFKFWRAVADLLFPRCCEVCGRELLLYERYLCLGCLAEMPLTYYWLYRDNPAEVVFWGRSYVDRVWSLFFYTQSYRNLVHSLKYKSNVPIGLWLGAMLGEKIDEPVDYIIPVPLHWRKKLKRGYNQSEIIAKGVVDGIKRRISSNRSAQSEKVLQMPIIITDLLVRRSFTKTQTHKDRQERWHNVSAAFSINEAALKKYNLRGRKALIIDDVLTTGATLEACASLLVEQLGCRVSIATLAYVE